jgi:hypothetical protein
VIVRGRRVRLDLLDLFLIVEFTFITFRFYPPVRNSAVGMDIVAYWSAANRWLAGQDPYADLGGLIFAAPPPTLAVLAPFALLPVAAFGVLMLAGSVLAAIFVMRRLGLPYWFLLFPPIFEALLVGNPNVIVVALLVAALPATDVAATFLKAYAILPVALLGRRRSVVWLAVALLVSGPFLPWPSYISHGLELVTVLNVQSEGGKSALSVPILIPFVLVALAILGRKRAAWLVVPSLWPATQLHYSVLALPASTRRMAAILALPIPGAPAVAVIVEAAVELWRRRTIPAQEAAATTQPAGPTMDTS